MKPFSPESTAKSVHATLEEAYAALPAGKSHAVLVDASTADGVRALYVQRVGDGWHIALEGAWKGHGYAPAGKVAAIKSW